MPSVGLYFGIYSYSKRTIIPRLQQSLGPNRGRYTISDSAVTTIGIATSAAIGNTIASFSRVPYEVVKQQLQTGQYPNTKTAITAMFRSKGVRAFFPLGGVSIQMVRDIPYAIITLLTYEAIQEKWIQRSSVQQKGWKDMASGAIAGGVGSYLTNPMDVVKTRLQTQPELYGGSMLACARDTFIEGGPAAFLRGCVPRLLHKVPANSLFFCFYEAFKRMME
mmetsp:Transcript_27162/g.78359  ORF Transcript_27162/g.78359 Transcript_27162/m.78359 type:complete len:221 (-) Transcript_27162:442-1104(-)